MSSCRRLRVSQNGPRTPGAKGPRACARVCLQPGGHICGETGVGLSRLRVALRERSRFKKNRGRLFERGPLSLSLLRPGAAVPPQLHARRLLARSTARLHAHRALDRLRGRPELSVQQHRFAGQAVPRWGANQCLLELTTLDTRTAATPQPRHTMAQRLDCEVD